MQQYTVTGMHCAACSASVEKAVKKVPGVTSCAVSLLTNSMGVEGTAEPSSKPLRTQATARLCAGRKPRPRQTQVRWRTGRRRILKSG